MDHRINLDAAADLIRARVASWRDRGVDVGEMTWADGQTFDHAVTPDRAAVRGDYSVGVKARRGTVEADLVLYAGGWCDLSAWSGDPDHPPVDETPGWDEALDLAAFNRVLDRFEGLLLS